MSCCDDVISCDVIELVLKDVLTNKEDGRKVAFDLKVHAETLGGASA